MFKDILETPVLLFKGISANKRSIFPNFFILSVIIAISTSIFIITDFQTSILFESTRDELTNKSTHHIEISIPYLLDYSNLNPDLFSAIDNNLASIFEDVEINFLEYSLFSSNVHLYMYQYINMTDQPLYGRLEYFYEAEMDNLLVLMNNGSRFPQNSNETLLIGSESILKNYHINSTYFFASKSDPKTPFPLTITGLLVYRDTSSFITKTQSNNYLIGIEELAGTIINDNEIIVISNRKDFHTIVYRLGESTGKAFSDIRHSKYAEFYYRLNTDALKPSMVDKYLSMMSNLRSKVLKLYPNSEINTEVFHDFLIRFQGKVFQLMLNLFIYSLPLILISVFMVRHAILITQEHRSNFISLLMYRGTSLRQMLFMAFIEVLVVFFSSLFTGTFLGWLITYTSHPQIRKYSGLTVINKILIGIMVIDLIVILYIAKGMLTTVFRHYFNKKVDVYKSKTKYPQSGVILLFSGILFYLALLVVQYLRDNLVSLFGLANYQAIYLGSSF
ncbi:MAG: hypothetical protein ACTSW1_01100, partial [Candidatus Hodarchaeales archaeon]